MNNKLTTTKSVLAAVWCIAGLLHTVAGMAAVATNIETPVLDIAEPSFIGGIALPAATAPLLQFKSVELDEVAEYDHLFPTDNPAGADPDIDLIETGAIVAGVFHSVAIPIHSFPVARRWVHIMQGIAECAAPGSCTGKSKLLTEISDAAAGKTLVEKVRIVNSTINNTIRYRADQSLYGKADYWATPQEVLAHASGDCEDFAILKMAALMRVGLPAKSLSLVVLRDNGRGVFHAVLAVTTSSGSFILDNARVKVAMDSDLPNYQPLYSLSDDRAWIHGTRVSEQPAVADIGDFSSIAPGEGFAAPRGETPSRPASHLHLRSTLPALR